MGDFLSDFMNDRLRPVPRQGTVNGAIKSFIENTEDVCEFSDDSDSEPEEYVRKELETYYQPEQLDEDIDRMTFIDDCGDSVLDEMEYVHVPEAFQKYKFDSYSKKELPIDSYKEKILNMISTNSIIIIDGPTGCGKTTQVPQYILDQCREYNSPCNIVVTQPRRIAAINIALRVCEERGWSVGNVCGYQVGLDKEISQDVILTYVTTEVLLQKLISQKNLNKYTHIIIDEVHERNKALDILMLIVRKFIFTNSSLVKIILMSATMDADEFAYYFRSYPRNNLVKHIPAPVLHVTKQSKYVTSLYYNEHIGQNDLQYSIEEPGITPTQYELCFKLINIFDSLDKNEGAGVGGVLVFLPGFYEIEEMHKILVTKGGSEEYKRVIIPLHSSLRSENMFKVFEKVAINERKIILTTNIAESSVTVPDVKYVVDFCLTKCMTVNSTTKFASLCLEWASHDNCTQRAGRVGRVSNGRVFRLVPSDFFETQMAKRSVPEIQRAPLENVVLYMKMMELNDTPKNILSLAITPPNLKDVDTCIWHLKEIGALLSTCRGLTTPSDGDLTFIGRVMGSLPIDIHLSKMILLGHMLNCLDETVIMAAGCMTKNIFVQSFKDRFKCYKRKLLWANQSRSDLFVLMTLYDVWTSKRRTREFSTRSEEHAWCKINFVNLKALKEWEALVIELHSRLKKLNIVPPAPNSQLKLTQAEKAVLIKIAICGAFYPNYFIRSEAYGQPDTKEAFKVLNDRDPFNTVYFTNMKVGHPGHIYVRQIKDMMQVDDPSKLQISFDDQSTKVFVQFSNIKHPEKIDLDGKQVIMTSPNTISPDVLEAIRKRQLNVPFTLQLLPDNKAWTFAQEREVKTETKEVNCFSDIEYSPFPSLDIEYISVTVTHIYDAGHFYCQNWNEETRILLNSIFTALNGPGVFLEPVSEKLQLHYKYYAARFNEDSKFYRCKIVDIIPGKPDFAHVVFVDYGNPQKVPTNLIYNLPEASRECKVRQIAMCCVLSNVQPHTLLSEKGIWPEKADNVFRNKTRNVLLNARVYSVVDERVHLELFLTENIEGQPSFNQWLIDENLAQKMEENQRSKMDHETRLKILNSENPNTASSLFSNISTTRTYVDFEAPSVHEATETLQLKGPHNPLEMKVAGMAQACIGAAVHIQGDSVNAVLLDDRPDDPHARLLVASQVTISSTGQTVKLDHTTLMPALPGLPMLMCLLFCPEMEPKLTPDDSTVAAILCGMGCRDFTEKANFPLHDLVLNLDTELNEKILLQVNEVRLYMNRAVKTMKYIYEELEFPKALDSIMIKLKTHLFRLLHMRQKSIDVVNVNCNDVWQKYSCPNLDFLHMAGFGEEEDDIWKLLWFVKLNNSQNDRIPIQRNLEELTQIAQRVVPAKEIICLLCNSEVLKQINDVRLHIFHKQHENNLAIFNGTQ